VSWRKGKTPREIGEELGYTYNCHGCGQKSDTPWCGCLEGKPEEDEREMLADAGCTPEEAAALLKEEERNGGK
jgi:hypothetical protein